MRALEFRWTLWALLPFLSSSFSEAAAPTTCSEMDSTYLASENGFSISCDMDTGSPAIYASYSLGDSFVSCITRCDIDIDCIAVSYQHDTGDCDLVASFVQRMPSSNHDVAVKAFVISSPTTSEISSTSDALSTSDAMSTTDSTTLQSTASSSDMLSTTEYTSLQSPAQTDEISTSPSTTLLETASTSDTLSTSDSTSIVSTASTTDTVSSDSTPLPSIASTTGAMSTSDSRTQLLTESTSDLLSTSESASISSPSSTATTLDILSTSSDSASLLSTSSFTSFLSTETSTSESTLILTTSGPFVSSSISLSGSTTSEDVTVSSMTSSVSTSLTLSNSAAVTESSTITSASFSASSNSESTSTAPTTSTAESVTIIASTSLSTITTAFQTPDAKPTTASASTTISTASSSASNVPYIEMYDYLGCLSSQEEFPSFTEIATASDMTVEKCIKVGAGSQYIGVHRRSCYKADSLSGTEFITDARCDIRCPGDSTVFCGGDNNAQTRRRRSIPSNFFLTLYRLSASASSASSVSLTSTLTPSSPIVTLPTSTAHSTTSNSIAVFTSNDSTAKTSETAVLTDITTATTSNTACITRTTLTDTVTSVTYVTVDTNLFVVTTCVPVTLVYSPCGCEHETYTTVDMTTVTYPCSTDASYTKDTITLTVPKACETLNSAGQTAVQYPSGWIWSQTYSGHGSYYLAQPTAGPKTDSGSDNTQPSQVVSEVRPETISQEGKASAGGAKATDRPQKATGEPSSEAGSNGYDHPEASVSQPTTSLHHEEIPAKESNGLETPSSSWITHHGNQDASTPASKTGSTDKTAQSNAPSESGAEGSTPMTVSGASRHRCVTWAVVGLALMFY